MSYFVRPVIIGQVILDKVEMVVAACCSVGVSECGTCIIDVAIVGVAIKLHGVDYVYGYVVHVGEGCSFGICAEVPLFCLLETLVIPPVAVIGLSYLSSYRGKSE